MSEKETLENGTGEEGGFVDALKNSNWRANIFVILMSVGAVAFLKNKVQSIQDHSTNMIELNRAATPVFNAWDSAREHINQALHKDIGQLVNLVQLPHQADLSMRFETTENPDDTFRKMLVINQAITSLQDLQQNVHFALHSPPAHFTPAQRNTLQAIKRMAEEYERTLVALFNRMIATLSCRVRVATIVITPGNAEIEQHPDPVAAPVETPMPATTPARPVPVAVRRPAARPAPRFVMPRRPQNRVSDQGPGMGELGNLGVGGSGYSTPYRLR